MTLTTLYSRAADATPDHPALIGADRVWSWAEAEAAVDALARNLVAAGIERGDRVAVLRLKDAASYLAMHGIVRAGAIAVPIDPMAPADHARTVLGDAEVAAVITDVRTNERVAPTTVDGVDLRVLIIDGGVDRTDRDLPWVDAISAAPDVTLPDVEPDDPAYLIYTSGSTGQPKGMVHTHRSASAYVEWAAAAHLTPDDRVAGVSGFHYDMSTLELWAAPRVGASVVVMGEGHLTFPASFARRLADERVTVVYAVSSLLRQVVDRGGLDTLDASAVRSVIFAGESYPPGALRSLFAAFPSAEVTNAYGPAETNVCTVHELPGPPVGDEEIPIGAPWFDAESSIRDVDGNELAPGSAGELWISTPTVMDGYWRRPDLSDPKLEARPDGRPPWYATGDLAIEDADGVLWFHGRADNQIKLRGVRIELEGVETVVEDAPGVLEGVVAPDGEGSDASNLIAFVVVADGTDFDAGAVRRHCVERLPPTHVPREVVVVESFPQTPSGKIDRSTVRSQIRSSHTTPGGDRS